MHIQRYEHTEREHSFIFADGMMIWVLQPEVYILEFVSLFNLIYHYSNEKKFKGGDANVDLSSICLACQGFEVQLNWPRGMFWTVDVMMQGPDLTRL